MTDYKTSGVDTQAADAWVERIAGQLHHAGPAELRARLKSGVGAYAAVYASTDAHWLALSCDGVGTKILWAQEGLGSAAELAQDLVAMNANDLLCVGATPQLFLDYLAVGSMDLVRGSGELGDFIQGLSAAAAESGMIVVGGETAQMPDIYGARGYDLAGFALGALAPAEHLTVERIRPGAELWGWASTGPHSNGFSWLRKLFSPAADATFIREHLMRPTKLYARDFLGLRQRLRETGVESALQGAFHITGSGVLNFIRAQPEGRQIGFDLAPWHSLPRAPWLSEVERRAQQPLWTAFNMGYGFCVVLAPELVSRAASLLNSVGLTRLGTVIPEPVVKVGGLELQ